tara:strand:- start:1361 stop:1873 length:513 start_codon:yes stop_codon:yes gene_type:complete
MDLLKANAEYYFFYIVDLLFERNHIDKIVEHLYIGNIYTALNKNVLKNNHIDVIINCSTDIPFIEDTTITTYRFPLEDDKSDKYINIMTSSLEHYVNIIEKHIQNNENVLVHCRAGVQRSASLVVAYIMKYLKLDLENATLFVKNCRHCIFFPSMNFRKSLLHFEKTLHR